MNKILILIVIPYKYNFGGIYSPLTTPRGSVHDYHPSCLNIVYIFNPKNRIVYDFLEPNNTYQKRFKPSLYNVVYLECG